MLTPCKPCSCPGAPCEQCMFGYQSDESNHRTMKTLIERTLNGEKPLAYKIAEKYMKDHPNWETEMLDGSEEKPVEKKNTGSLQTGILAQCGRCGWKDFFADKNNRGDADGMFARSEWIMIGNVYVCPACNNKYQELMKKFLNELRKKED